ncbi:hypothetical protein QF000_005734 [Paraburkholderia atlantica]|uniref:hypothetical protein n=1 Tax=Paraburkholderia atlantica TaxID=2654982 RepID=UPI003D222E50
MNKAPWVLAVKAGAGQPRIKKFESAEAAEAAAYIAKIADPRAMVLIACDPRVGLLWDGDSWNIVAFWTTSGAIMGKSVADFTTARREHDLIFQGMASALTFFR